MMVPERPQMTKYCIACWISKATRPRSATRTHALMHAGTHARAYARSRTQKYVILLFHGNNCFVNSPQCYVIRSLSALFILR